MNLRRQSGIACGVGVVLVVLAVGLILVGIRMAFERVEGNLPNYLVNAGTLLCVAAMIAWILSLIQGVRWWRSGNGMAWWIVLDGALIAAAIVAGLFLLSL